MGALDDPGHFHRWLAAHPEALPPGAPALPPLGFAPRRTFGAYLVATFEAAVGECAPGVTVTRHADEAVDVRREDGRAVVVLAGGTSLVADRVVLALGNFPPRPVVPSESALAQSPRYVNDPWAPGALDAVAADPAPTLLVGTGLTMVDVALFLRERRPRKTMTALSRRGYLPQVHRLGPPYPLPPETTFPTSIRALSRWLRREVARGAERGFPWQAVVDALRPHTPSIWRSLPIAEQRRFLRHARAHWDVHRHRIAPEIADRLAALRAGKHLTIVAGRLERLELDASGVTVTYRPRSASVAKSLPFGHVVNCTGPDARYAPEVSPLIASLRRRGWIRPHPLGLGLDGALDGRLADADGTPSSWLFGLGPMRQPLLWESVAVPELRDQAPALAEALLQSLTPSHDRLGDARRDRKAVPSDGAPPRASAPTRPG
jgi:uncharacterized NAD(P)/FAD-binding protein YdhS